MPVAETWQSTQRSFPCTDFENGPVLSISTAGLESASLSFLSGAAASWQSRQAWFGIRSVAAQPPAAARRKASAEIGRRSVVRPVGAWSGMGGGMGRS